MWLIHNGAIFYEYTEQQWAWKKQTTVSHLAVEKIAVLMISKQIANVFEISVWQMCVVMSQEWMLTNWENKISNK